MNKLQYKEAKKWRSLKQSESLKLARQQRFVCVEPKGQKHTAPEFKHSKTPSRQKRRGRKRNDDSIGRSKSSKRTYTPKTNYCGRCKSYCGTPSAHRRSLEHKIRIGKRVRLSPKDLGCGMAECRYCSKTFSSKSRHFPKCCVESHLKTLEIRGNFKKTFIKIADIKNLNGTSSNLFNVCGIYIEEPECCLIDADGIHSTQPIPSAKTGDIVELRRIQCDSHPPYTIRIYKHSSIAIYNQEGDAIFRAHAHDNTAEDCFRINRFCEISKSIFPQHIKKRSFLKYKKKNSKRISDRTKFNHNTTKL